MRPIEDKKTWRMLAKIVEKKEDEMTQDNVKAMIVEFLSNDPSEAQIEEFYINKVLPIDNRSINEILNS